MSVLDSVKQRVSDLRERRPVVDHLVRALEHYGQVNGSALAAAVTYFAFLSFFPILALAFAIFGQVTKVYEDAQDTLVDAANSVLPGLVGGESGVPLDTLQAAAPGIFSVGIVLTLYSGLGWLSGMRSALMAIFEEPEREQPSFLIGKLRDVLALMALGSVLVASVAVSGVATKVLTPIMEALDLGVVAEGFLWVLALCLGLAASTLLFFAFFRLLAQPEHPQPVAVVRRVPGGRRVRGPQAALHLPAQGHGQLRGVPGLRHRADPDGVDQLHLPRRRPLRCVGPHLARGARPPRREPGRRPDARGTPHRPRRGSARRTLRLGCLRAASSPKAAFAAGAAAMLGLVALLRRRS